jgi:Chalcone isomerase-like
VVEVNAALKNMQPAEYDQRSNRVREPGLKRSTARAIFPALLWWWLAWPAAAATLAGVTLPDSYTVDGQSLRLNGIGLRTLTFLRVRIYVAALYLPRPSHDAGQILASPGPKVVRLQFIHSGSKAQVEKQYREGEAKNCGNGECAPSDLPDFEALVAAAPAVKPGDTSTYVFTDRGVKVLANDEVIGDFADVDLAHQLLTGFIGEHPPSQSLREQLLGVSAE